MLGLSNNPLKHGEPAEQEFLHFLVYKSHACILDLLMFSSSVVERVKDSICCHDIEMSDEPNKLCQMTGK